MDRQRFFDLANELYELHKTKSADYGDPKIYFPLGDASYAQVLYMKTMRIVNLAAKPAEPNHESKRDSVRDLINYGMFYLDYLENHGE